MALMITGENDTKDVHAAGTVEWSFRVATDAPKIKFAFAMTTGPDEGDAPEWTIALHDVNDEVWSNYGGKTEYVTDGPASGDLGFKLQVVCPAGARYGDTVSISVTVTADGEESVKTYSARAVQSIMILKTQIDQEKTVVDSLVSKSNIGAKDIYAILSPNTLRGYVFVEGMNTDRIVELSREIKKAKGFVQDKKRNIDGSTRTGEISIEEIDSYLTPLSTVVGIVEGDLVELINGPFKGEKARVQQIDETKEEITVELIEAMVPIPVTVKGDSVRVIEKEK